MSSRQAIPLAGVLSLLAAGVVAGWFLVPRPVPLSPITPPPQQPEPDEVALAPLPRFVVERYDPIADMKAVVALAQFSPIDPDPRTAEAQSVAVLDRFDTLRYALRVLKSETTATHEPGPAPPRDWCRSPVALENARAAARERDRIDSHLKQLNTEETNYQQRLARTAATWMSSRVDLPGRVAEWPDGIGLARRRSLREAARSSKPDIADAAATALAHLRRTHLEAQIHRVIGKDHGSVGELVTEVLLVDAVVERLESIDDGVRGAAHVHATWRGELAARFAESPADVTPPEVAAWLLSGCFLAAAADGPSGADFAFLDPARNPDLGKAAASRPFRRLLQEWAANHDKDTDAARAAAVLLKAVAK